MECIIAQTFHIMDGPTQESLSSMPGPIMGTTGLRIARPYYGHHRTSYSELLPGPIMGTTGLRIARPYYGHHRTSYIEG